MVIYDRGVGGVVVVEVGGRWFEVVFNFCLLSLNSNGKCIKQYWSVSLEIKWYLE